MNSLEQALVKTLAWFDIFNYPMTDWEISRWLWAPGLDKADCAYDKIRSALQNPSPWLAERMENQGAWYFLKGKAWLVEKRHQQHLMFKKRWAAAKHMAQIASFIPNLHLFALCNLFRLEYSKPTSDIDIFVVTSKNRIWSVRLILTMLVFLLRKWRHGRQVAGRLCLSFYVTDDVQNLSSIALADDIYLTYWTALLAPLYRHVNFFSENKWLHEYLPNFYPPKQSFKYRIKDNPRENKTSILNILGNLLEKATRSIQLKYMGDKPQQFPPEAVIVSDQMLKFHNFERREHFKKLWQNSTNVLLN